MVDIISNKLHLYFSQIVDYILTQFVENIQCTLSV